uniref:uncharacterized protein LOC100176279 n=1 Tax=Ciona intestinalis TaxID=7719 RepID=UPI0002B8DC6E|nr:uncharacterized protein LOC100176279 [Ciona intestinalis]|eukprot:XP_002125718.2 uncharacterized protein LOC100176279 [Ciona intestinalis]
MDKVESKETKAWRGSLLLNFGDGVGVSLDELGREYDEMITTFEEQKQRLRQFIPNGATLSEDQVTLTPPRSHSPTLSASSTSSKKMKRGISASGLNTLRSAQASLKKKFSRSHLQKSPLVERKATGSKDGRFDSDTGSLDSEVFMSSKGSRKASEDSNHNNSTHQKDENIKTLDVNDTKPPVSPTRERCATVNTSHKVILTPPVLVDGEVRKDFQYLSPSHTSRFNTMDTSDRRNKKVFRSGSFARLIGKSDCVGGKKQRRVEDDSPLKALYKATVQHSDENINNNNYRTANIVLSPG